MPNDMSPIDQGEKFSITNFLEGRTRAWGIFEDRFGNVKLRLNVVMNGSWSGDTFILDEEFQYQDGRRETRQWRVKPTSDGLFTATCEDCIGEAAGFTKDGRVEMRYRFRLKLQKKTLNVSFLDRLIKIDEKRAVNRAAMYKWGIKLGELSLFFEK